MEETWKKVSQETKFFAKHFRLYEIDQSHHWRQVVYQHKGVHAKKKLHDELFFSYNNILFSYVYY